MKILTIIGTRPEIIKMAPLINLFDKQCDHILIHSGQHYSRDMDEIIFEDLQLRKPDRNLQVGSLSPGKQVAAVIESFEECLEKYQPDAVVLQGDTNTTLGGAIATAKYVKNDITLVHIEAGARSGIRKQVEEINRKIVDQISDLLFAANSKDRENLLKEGIADSRIFITGNTVIESSYRMAKLLPDNYTNERFNLIPNTYCVATFHRQESVDSKQVLKTIVNAMNKIGDKIKLVIPLHPRTVKRLNEFNLVLNGKKMEIIQPLGYKDMISLVQGARVCITDSGGLQEEAAILGTPVLVLREKTEHGKYINSGFNLLCPPNKGDIVSSFFKIWQSPPASVHIPSSYPSIAGEIYSIIQAYIDG